MDVLSNEVAESSRNSDYFLCIPFFLAFLLFLWNRQRSRLPPLSSLPMGELVELVLTGRLHHRLLEISKDIGLVYRVYFPLQMAHHFIICDATLGRLILEGDVSRQISPGEKLDRMALFDRLTMNKPNILSKKTHGEGWGEFEIISNTIFYKYFTRGSIIILFLMRYPCFNRLGTKRCIACFL
jgi:hypothetical protein